VVHDAVYLRVESSPTKLHPALWVRSRVEDHSGRKEGRKIVFTFCIRSDSTNIVLVFKYTIDAKRGSFFIAMKDDDKKSFPATQYDNFQLWERGRKHINIL
jgi:hypothetical protein